MCLCGVALTIGSQSFATRVEQPRPSGDSSIPEKVAQTHIVITGSRIPRTDLTAVSPVTMVKGEEFKLKARRTRRRSQSASPGQSVARRIRSRRRDRTATVDLRGLGAVRTLVLVNGHRLMPGDPRYPVPDVNSIPTALIQRVEVLTGGAAAVYGSDAVAGVVNFILDTNLDGLKSRARSAAISTITAIDSRKACSISGNSHIRKAVSLDGRRENVSAAFGRSFFDGRAHVTIYGGYRQIAASDAGPARLWQLAPSPPGSSIRDRRPSWNAAVRSSLIPGTFSTISTMCTRSRPTGRLCPA